MGFILGLVALVAAFFTFINRYNDNAFDAYVKAKLGDAGKKWKVVFWAAVAFAAWSMLTFNPVPAYVALFIYLIVWVVWLSSDAGQKFLKDLV